MQLTARHMDTIQWFGETQATQSALPLAVLCDGLNMESHLTHLIHMNLKHTSQEVAAALHPCNAQRMVPADRNDRFEGRQPIRQWTPILERVIW